MPNADFANGLGHETTAKLQHAHGRDARGREHGRKKEGLSEQMEFLYRNRKREREGVWERERGERRERGTARSGMAKLPYPAWWCL